MMGLLLLLLHPGQRSKSACMYPSSPQSSLLLYSCRLQDYLLLQYQTVRYLHSRIRFHPYFLRIYFLQIYFPQNCFRCCLHQRFLPFQTLPDFLPDQSFLPFRRNFHFQNFPLQNFLLRCFLLRLGFIGAEYKAARKILLKNLNGSSAFKTAKEENDNDISE